jgi:predicted Holliday junction resolvase-like endonuclease
VWASFGDWLLGQAPALVVMGMWVLSLLRASSEKSLRIQSLERRTDELSGALAEKLRSDSQETLERALAALRAHEQTLKHTLERFAEALARRRSA